MKTLNQFHNRTKVRAPDSKTRPVQFHDPVILGMIEEGVVNSTNAEEGSHEYFEGMLRNAVLLYQFKCFLADRDDTSPDDEPKEDEYKAFAARIRVSSRTHAYQLVKLHKHLEFARAWAAHKIRNAREKHQTVPVLRWQDCLADALKDDDDDETKPKAKAPGALQRLAEMTKERDRALIQLEATRQALKQALHDLELARQEIATLRKNPNLKAA